MTRGGLMPPIKLDQIDEMLLSVVNEKSGMDLITCLIQITKKKILI